MVKKPFIKKQHLSTATKIARSKVDAVYGRAPSAAQEALDVAELTGSIKRSKHQEYMHQLTVSGKSLPEIQAEWHQYYAGLTDSEKHQVWNDYNTGHYKAASIIAGTKDSANKPSQDDLTEPKTIAQGREAITQKTSSKRYLKPKQHFQSLLFGLAVGSAVLVIFLFSFFNERFIAPFIQPSRNITNTPIILTDGRVGPESVVIIPKINVEIPVVYGSDNKEEAIQTALENGVVHYTNTALPGNSGNVAIVGHSSNNIFNNGKYKFAFVLLSRMEIGDTFYLQKDGVRYTYAIYDKKIVKPSEVGVLGPQDKPSTATLITCDPPGTNTNRLVVVGQQINPDPTNNPLAQTPVQTTQPTVIPSNAPSLWSRITGLF